MNSTNTLRSILAVCLVGCWMVSFSQNTITLQKRNGKPKVVDLSKVFYIIADSAEYMGSVSGFDGDSIYMVNSNSSKEDNFISIHTSTIKMIWVCPKKTNGRCDKWRAKQAKRDIMFAGVGAVLYSTSLISTFGQRKDAFLVSVSLFAVLTPIAILHNPKVYRIERKWRIVEN